jgi:hypothetical protein
MAEDPRLKKLRDMDPIIGTFTARELVSSPDFVNQVYRQHAETHMSLGDTSNYVTRLLRWTKTNKGTVVGAIAGKFGYGKTSTAIHFWHQCEQARVVAVPPFEWYRLQDIIDATWSWVHYRLEKLQPEAAAQLDSIYERYREKSVQEFADEERMAVSKVQDLLDRGKIHLHSRPEDVIGLLSEVSELLESDELRLYGPVVFTDELQVTMSRYMARKRSRDEFMQDLFELLNPLINQEGSFGLVVGLPQPTEAIINDIRSDIQHRLQHCHLFVRTDSMYERDFPAQLWRRFAEVFEFEDIADDILPADTIDSIGQIASRSDLGAGPRTVIQAMRCAIKHYDETGQASSPIDLMDAYLGRQVDYDVGGKLITVMAEILQSKEVKQVDGGDRVVKLMAAFPMGCPEKRFETYGLQDAKDEIAKRLYAEFLYKFPEGVSLRGLARTERGAEPRFIALTKDFIQNYSESERDLDAAVQAFREEVVQKRLLSSRRKDQIEGWIPAPQVAGQYVGTFDPKYPERRLLVNVSRDRAEAVKSPEELGLGFWFDPNTDYDSPGRIESVKGEGGLALFQLNLLRQPSRPLNIPYVGELGYPLRKVNPAFMLALVQHLRDNEHLIPEDEKRVQMPPFLRSLVDYSIQLLFGEEILENTEFEGLSKVGLELPKQVFSRMCRSRYPDYQTLITTGRWQPVCTAYLNALNSQAVSSSLSVLRGNRPLELPQRDALTLLSQTRVQSFKAIVENLAGLLEADLGAKADSSSTLRFKQHPAEQAFLEALAGSEEKITREQMGLGILDQYEGFDLLRRLGYREDEIAFLIDMLKTRRLIDYDAKQQCFIEVVESAAERQDALVAVVSDLTKRTDILAEIPDFDDDWFLTEAAQIKEKVRACDDTEMLEEYQVRLQQLRDTLNQFSKQWAAKIDVNFENIRHVAGQMARAGLPAELSRPLKSDVSWVGELAQCRALLEDKYQRCYSAFRSVEKRVTSAWSTWTSAPPNDPEALVLLYRENRAAQSEIEEAQTSLEAAKGYLRGYSAWSNVLNAASRAYRDALGCETSYKEERFRQALDAVFGEIIEQFQKKRLEALPNHEMYADKFQEIQDQINEWLRGRRESFMQAKRFYEETLKAFGVDRHNLRAAFDSFDPNTSRGNLYSEVLEKTVQYVQSLEQELRRYHTEILYAEQVIGTDVSEPSGRLEQARNELQRVKGQVQDECIRQEECFTVLGERLTALRTTIRDVVNSLRGIRQKRTPTSEERDILDLLEDPRGTDLRVVITSRLAEESDEFSLDELMQAVTSLFKKNQVIIRVEKTR